MPVAAPYTIGLTIAADRIRETQKPGVGAVDRAEAAEQRAVDDDRLGGREAGAGRDAEGEAVDHVVELRARGQEQRADLLEELAHDRHQQHEHQQAAPPDPPGALAEVDRRQLVTEQPGVPQEREADAERRGRADRAEHDGDRLVLPLVDVVHVDDVDRGHDQRRRDEREGEEAQSTGDDRDEQTEAQRPPIGLGRRAAGQRHQRRHHVERHDRLAGLQGEGLPPLGATGPELGPGHGVEASARGRHGRRERGPAVRALRCHRHGRPPVCEVVLGMAWSVGAAVIAPSR